MSTYPDLVAYHCIAVTLGQAGHLKELFDVIDSMQSSPKKKFETGVIGKWDPRLKPDIVVFNAVSTPDLVVICYYFEIPVCCCNMRRQRCRL